MADIYVKGPHNTVIKYADQLDGTHAEVVSAVGTTVAAADITDAGAVGIDLLQSVTVANALDALTFSATAQSFVVETDSVAMRSLINAQEASTILSDIATASWVQGDIAYYNGTNMVRLAPGTSGQFLKTLGAAANPAWDTIAGGGDMLSTNNLSDVASAATALGNLGGAAATGGTMTTKTLAGLTTISGTQLFSASAMAADEIDITQARNTKTVPAANPTYTFSGAPASGQTWGLELTGDTAARTVTIPSTFDMQTQTTRTTFLMPANAKATIEWRNDGSVNRAWGIPGALDNYSATTAPTVNDDAADGYAVGSVWFNTTTDVVYDLYDATATAADWRPRVGVSRQVSKSEAYTLVMSDAGAHILHPSADTTARTWTIPANASVAFPVGTAVTFVNQNAAGVLTIAITTDTLRFTDGTTGNRTIAANGIATALKVTTTEWLISGVNVT